MQIKTRVAVITTPWWIFATGSSTGSGGGLTRLCKQVKTAEDRFIMVLNFGRVYRDGGLASRSQDKRKQAAKRRLPPQGIESSLPRMNEPKPVGGLVRWESSVAAT